MCIACIGAKHVQALVANPQAWPHFFSKLVKILERRLRVAVVNSQDPQSIIVVTGDSYQPRATMSSADMM